MLTTRGGVISVDTDEYGRSKEFTAFICNPARKPICQINGTTTFDIAVKFNDISTIDFVVQRYIENASTHETEENRAYTYLHSFCQIYVPELGDRGFFILNSEPDISAESTVYEYKTFTAQSYESVLLYENLILFDINTGSETSRETWEDTDGDYFYPPRTMLYNPNDPSTSLLDHVLKDDYYGWTIGHVDESIRTKECSFSVDNQSVYSFLREDMSKAFRCIVEFNTVDKEINVYNIETIGNDTNIYLSFANFVSLIGITPASDDIYTVFNVAGGNDLGIEEINFGSNKIIDISYPLSMCDQSLQEKYAGYVNYKNGQREVYTDIALDLIKLQNRRDSLMDRQPDDTLTVQWSSPTFTLEELQKELEYMQAYIVEIENSYRDEPEEGSEEPGPINWTDLNESLDAATYYSFKDVAIPDLIAEIERREAGSEYIADTIEQEYVWDIYGLYDLINEESLLKEQIATLKAMNFHITPYDQSIHNVDPTTYNNNHALYLKYTEKLEELQPIIAERQARVDELDAQINALKEDMKAIAQEVSLEYNTGENKLFSQEEAAIITSLYRESDYSDDNYMVLDYFDTLASIEEERQLYEAAEKRLAIESQPQIAWNISTADLFNIEEFKPLRDNLQIGDFIILGYGIDGYTKLRCVEFDFSGLKTETNFTITFSTYTTSKYQNDDYENLLGDYLTSKTNQISVRANTAAANTATKVAASMVRPYVQIMKARLEEADIQKANIQELQAVWGHFTTLLADYIEADQLVARVAEIDSLTATDAIVQNLTSEIITAETVQAAVAYVDYITDDTGNSYWNLRTGELCLNGYIFSTRVEFGVSNDRVNPPQTWSTSVPAQTDDQFLWQRIVMIESDGSEHPAQAACIQGARGKDGEDAISVQIESSTGNIFKNRNISATLTCTVWKGSENITGQVASFRWTKRNEDGTLDPTWTRVLSGNTTTINADDVRSKAIFSCEVTLPD